MATLFSTNWDRRPGKFNARLAERIPKKELFVAHVEYVLCFRRNKQKRPRIELTSSQILCTSSNKENPENAMDRKSGSHIIGKPKMQPTQTIAKR